MIRKVIKTAVFLGLCVITLGMINPWMLNAGPYQKGHYRLQKTYLDPSQIRIDSDGIHIKTGRAAKTLKNQSVIFHDQKGFYIQENVLLDIAEDHSHHVVFQGGDCAHPTCPYYYDLLDW